MLVGRLKGKIMDKLGVRVEEYILKMRDDIDEFENRYEKTGGQAIGKTPRKGKQQISATTKKPKEPKPFIPIEDRLALGSDTSVLYTYNSK